MRLALRVQCRPSPSSNHPTNKCHLDFPLMNNMHCYYFFNESEMFNGGQNRIQIRFNLLRLQVRSDGGDDRGRGHNTRIEGNKLLAGGAHRQKSLRMRTDQIRT